MRLAAELGLPLVTVIDTQGAALSAEAENGGLAGEIARCLADLVTLDGADAVPDARRGQRRRRARAPARRPGRRRPARLALAAAARGRQRDRAPRPRPRRRDGPRAAGPAPSTCAPAASWTGSSPSSRTPPTSPRRSASGSARSSSTSSPGCIARGPSTPGVRAARYLYVGVAGRRCPQEGSCAGRTLPGRSAFSEADEVAQRSGASSMERRRALPAHHGNAGPRVTASPRPRRRSARSPTGRPRRREGRAARGRRRRPPRPWRGTVLEPAGEISSSSRAGSSSAFQNVCHWPRGLNTRSPTSATCSSSPSRTETRPSRTKLYSSSRRVHVQRRRDRPRREQVLDEREPPVGVVGVDQEAVPAAGRRAEHQPGPGSDDLSVGHGRHDCAAAVALGHHPRNLVLRPDGLRRTCPRPGRAAAARGSDLLTLWREVAPVLRDGRAALRDAVLLHRRPRVAAGDQPLPGGAARRSPRSGWAASTPSADYNSMGEVLASRAGVGTLHEATGGRPELARSTTRRCSRSAASRSWSSPCAPARRVLGLGRAVPRGGSAAVRRGRGDVPAYGGPAARRGARHGLRSGQALDPDLPDAPAVLVLDEGLELAVGDGHRRRWLDPRRLARPTSRSRGHRGRQGAAAEDGRRGPGPRARRPLGAGARLGAATGGSRVGRSSKRPQPAHLETLLMQAHGLTATRARGDPPGAARRSTTEVATDCRRRGHGPAAPQVGLREDRRAQPTRAGRHGLPRRTTSHGSATTSTAPARTVRCATARCRGVPPRTAGRTPGPP